MKDWRGVEVKIGDQVIYAVGHGSSLTMVEAVVVDFVKDKARVKVIRRQGWTTKDIVSVSNTYLTVVTFPESDTETLQEKNAAKQAALDERRARQAACPHTSVTNGVGYNYTYWKCDSCGKFEYSDDK